MTSLFSLLKTRLVYKPFFHAHHKHFSSNCIQSIVESRGLLENLPCFRKPSLSCVIVLSIGQTYHEGKKFMETVEYACNNFDNLTLVKADSLQRYNFEQNETIEECKEKYLRKSENWEKRHSQAISSLKKKKFQLMSWDDFLNMPLYKEALDIVMAFYEKDPLFRKAVEVSVDEYVKRQRKITSHRTVDLENEWANASKSYILEESTVLFLWEFSHILYPRKPNSALCYLLNQIRHINSNALQLVPPRKLKKIFGKEIMNQLDALLCKNELSESEQLYVLHELQSSCLNFARSLKCISGSSEMLINMEKATF